MVVPSPGVVLSCLPTISSCVGVVRRFQRQLGQLSFRLLYLIIVEYSPEKTNAKSLTAAIVANLYSEMFKGCLHLLKQVCPSNQGWIRDGFKLERFQECRSAFFLCSCLNCGGIAKCVDDRKLLGSNRTLLTTLDLRLDGLHRGRHSCCESPVTCYRSFSCESVRGHQEAFKPDRTFSRCIQRTFWNSNSVTCK